jgi:hypothetical protein
MIDALLSTLFIGLGTYLYQNVFTFNFRFKKLSIYDFPDFIASWIHRKHSISFEGKHNCVLAKFEISPVISVCFSDAFKALLFDIIEGVETNDSIYEIKEYITSKRFSDKLEDMYIISQRSRFLYSKPLEIYAALDSYVEESDGEKKTASVKTDTITITLYSYKTNIQGIKTYVDMFERIAQFGVTPLLVYLSSWIGWFASNRGWDRHHSSNIFSSFMYYHQQMLEFHTGLVQRHSYQANPWSWLIMARPTSFYYETPTGCNAQSCSQEILALGTPLLWWLGTIALLVTLGLWLRSIALRRIDPALSLIVTGIAAGYLPWFFFQKRTVFSFYAIVFEPFLILALIYCARSLISGYGRSGEIVVAAALVLIAINFIYFLPLYIGDVLTYDAWHARMWFTSWI